MARVLAIANFAFWEEPGKRVNTMWATDTELNINPPCWESALHFLDTFTCMDSEFGVIDLVTTGMFDLSHPETASELDMTKALRAIRHKSLMAKNIVKWVASNREALGDYPKPRAVEK